MKTRFLIIIVISIIIFLLAAVVYPTINYKTWGNNERYYTPFSVGTKVVCDEWLWQPPQNCHHESVFKDSNNNLGQLKEIIGNCNCQLDPERTCEHTLIDWQNSTHYIDNSTCKWKSVDGGLEIENNTLD